MTFSITNVDLDVHAQYVALHSWWYGEEITELELSIDELVNATLGTNYAQDFDLNVDLDLVDVCDVGSHWLKHS